MKNERNLAISTFMIADKKSIFQLYAVCFLWKLNYSWTHRSLLCCVCRCRMPIRFWQYIGNFSGWTNSIDWHWQHEKTALNGLILLCFLVFVCVRWWIVDVWINIKKAENKIFFLNKKEEKKFSHWLFVVCIMNINIYVLTLADAQY